MSNAVWISNAPIDPTIVRSLTHSKLQQDLDSVVDVYDRNMAGEPLPPELFPTSMEYKPDNSSSKALPDLFKGGGQWVVSGKCAAVMRRFDLGNGNLYPVEIRSAASTGATGGSYFCLNFGNVKKALLPNESVGLRPAPGGRWSPRATFVDDDIALSTVALSGPDIWLDPAMPLTFFFGGGLMEALSEASADRGFGAYSRLRRCRIVA